MSRGDRRKLYAAIFGLILFSGLEGYLVAELIHARRQQQTTEASQRPAPQRRQEPQQADTDRAGVPGFAERLISNPEPGEGTQREKRDLAAQEANAAWAFWLTVIATIQAILGTIGIIFIWQSLKATREAVQEAGLATKAAQATADAYVAVERARLVASVKNCFRDSQGRINVVVQAENIGKSTGYVEGILWDALGIDWPPERFSNFQSAGKAVHAEQVETVGVIIASDRLDRRPYVGGIIQYRSAFRETHKCYFCFEVTERLPKDYGGEGPVAAPAKGSKWPKDT